MASGTGQGTGFGRALVGVVEWVTAFGSGGRVGDRVWQRWRFGRSYRTGGRVWGADGVWQVDNRMIPDRSGRGGMVDDPWPQ